MVKKCKGCKNCECNEREAFYRTFEDGKPYTDIDVNGIHVRFFPKTTEPHLLKWHTDEEDRVVTPLNENDWRFQFDNDLPISMNSSIHINKGIHHRILKGSTDLFLKIEKPCQ